MDKTKLFRIWHFALVGALLGAAFFSWFAPKLIAWYFDPPVDIGVNCKAATEWSMQNLRVAQCWGVLLGAALAITIAFLLDRSKSKQPS